MGSDWQDNVQPFLANMSFRGYKRLYVLHDNNENVETT